MSAEEFKAWIAEHVRAEAVKAVAAERERQAAWSEFCIDSDGLARDNEGFTGSDRRYLAQLKVRL